MQTAEPKPIGRFLEHKLPDGSVIYYEDRGDKHYYHGEIQPSSSAKGGYSFVKGSTLTGVTTATKYLDGDPEPLMNWAVERAEDGMARIATADMDAGRDVSWLRERETIRRRLDEEEANWRHERDRRAEVGTRVHKEMVWKLATGQPATLAGTTEMERGFSQGVFASFRELGLLGNVEYAEQVTVAHDKKIAGTFDVWAEGVPTAPFLERLVNPDKVPTEVAELPTLRLLADYKTRDGAGKIRKSDMVQVRGYEDCNQSCGLPASDGQVVIIVLPDGTYEVYWGEATYGQWVAARNSCMSAKPLDSRMRALKKAAKNAAEVVSA